MALIGSGSEAHASQTIEITKIYRTNMTRNYARKVVSNLEIRMGTVIRLQEAILPDEHQPKGVSVNDPQSYEFEVIEVAKDRIALTIKSGKKLGFYRFDQSGKASPVTPVEGEFQLNANDPIQVVKFVTNPKDMSSSAYDVTFQLKLLP